MHASGEEKNVRRRASSTTCADCIGDQYLARVIGEGTVLRACSFCRKVKPVAEVAAVASAADERLTEIARRIIPFEDPVDLDAGVRWESDGRRLGELVAANLSRAAQGVSESITKHLLAMGKQRRTESREPAWSGRHRYTVALLPYSHAELEELWTQYRNLVDGGVRFFNDDAREFLDELFEAMHRLKMRGLFKDEGLTRELKVSQIFRARVANTDEDVAKILTNPMRELNAPPPRLARTGRMNAERVAVFYGAFDKDTAVAEMRPAIGGQIVVGQFSMTRPLKVLDMPMLELASGATISIWDPAFKKRSAMRALLRRLHERVKRPVAPGAEHEYLATQMLAEYLSVYKGVDGVVFGSAQHEGGRNVVFFASTLGKYDAETGTFPNSPLRLVDGAAQVVEVKGVKYTLEPAHRRYGAR